MNPEDTQETLVTPEELKVPEPAYDFRYIKLSNGEEILCQVPVTQVEDLLLVRFPLKVNTMYDPTLGEAIYVFTPWIPFTGQELISAELILGGRPLLTVRQGRPGNLPEKDSVISEPNHAASGDSEHSRRRTASECHCGASKRFGCAAGTRNRTRAYRSNEEKGLGELTQHVHADRQKHHTEDAERYE